MEHHRLKPMKEGYDQELFNKLYKETSALRRKLAFQIDSRKFGVDYQEILSWFDVKFIHTFNKYWDKEPKRLMGYIINSLQTYKYRVMRSSYQVKYHTHAHQLDITTVYGETDIKDETSEDIQRREFYMDRIMQYMKDKLTDDALLVLQVQLNPPPFIAEQMEDEGKKQNTNIPSDILIDFLGLSSSENAEAYIKDLRKQIRKATNNCAAFFSNQPIHELEEAI